MGRNNGDLIFASGQCNGDGTSAAVNIRRISERVRPPKHANERTPSGLTFFFPLALQRLPYAAQKRWRSRPNAAPFRSLALRGVGFT